MSRGSSGRFYFSRDGKQFDHALQGSVFEGTGAFVDAAAANTPGAGAFSRRRTSITIGRNYDPRTVTCADFDNKRVMVKLWHPGDSEWFLLVPTAESCGVCGCEMPHCDCYWNGEVVKREREQEESAMMAGLW